MITGRPRKRSTYTVASARSGQNTGPRRVRSDREEQPEDQHADGAASQTTALSRRP